jgi:hypothetical protein
MTATMDSLFDRRRRQRIPLRREISFHRTDCPESGAGTTVNISDKALAFTATADLPVGALLEISVSWPAEVGAPLRMIASGRVVRRDGALIACTIDNSRFIVNSLPN